MACVQQLKSVMGDPPGLGKFLRTDGNWWHRVDCSFKVRVLVLNPACCFSLSVGAAPASPEGRLGTEDPAPETHGLFRSATEHGVCSNLGVTGGRGCNYLIPDHWDKTLHFAAELTSFGCHDVWGLAWVLVKPVALVHAPSTNRANCWGTFEKVACQSV